jgi:CobQ-like glutamine amidotransferase family enzyme
MFKKSPEQGGVETDSLRLAIDERLTGIQAVREGNMDVYFLTGPPDREPIVVTTQNADEVEAKLREAFSERYPDLSVDGKQQ